MTAAILGLGLAAIGRPSYITSDRAADLGDADDRSIEAMRARTWEMLDSAWAHGIRYIDAARSYGYAEAFLGGWLAAHPERRAELTIGSKWGYEYVGDWRMDAELHERKEHSLALLTRQWDESLAALGSTPDVYLIHSVTPESPALGDDGILDMLRRIAAGGTRVGFSTSGPRQGDVIASALRIDDSPFSAVQSTWNLLEPSVAPALEQAHDAGWLVVLKEVFANGRLTTDADAADSALRAALARPWADVVLTGAATTAQLAQNVAAARACAEGQADAGGQAPKSLSSPIDPERYWAERSARAWA